MRIAIVDDEVNMLEIVEQHVENYYRSQRLDVEIVTYTKSQMLLFDIDGSVVFDLYILDIEMPDISGMELARAIRTHDQESYILFVTSYLNYSIEGYELGIFRYIPKHLLEEKIVEALDTFTKEMCLKNEKNYIIRTNSRYEKILYKEITYIYKSGKNAIFVCDNNESKVRKSLKKVYEELDSCEFMFIERGYIVNINQLEKVAKDKVFMKNSEILHIGRSYQKEVKMKLADFWSEYL